MDLSEAPAVLHRRHPWELARLDFFRRQLSARGFDRRPVAILDVGSGDAWFARKTIVGRRCYNRIEAEFVYDSKRQLTHTEITGGKLVTEEDYDEDQRKAAPA